MTGHRREKNMDKIRCIAVVGPTASGKTKLAVELAKRYRGEVVSADSMQIYKEMNIAVAKPTADEMEGIPHHLIDFCGLEQVFSVSDYVSLARKTIGEIISRGNTPVIAGGTGLYISSLIDNVEFSSAETDPALRESLRLRAEQDGGAQLYAYLQQIDPQAARQIHPNNLIRVIRAVELFEITGKTMTQHKEESRRNPSPYDVCMLGLDFADRQKLYDRINHRVDLMVQDGLLEEARRVFESGNLKTAYNAIGFKELIPYLEGKEPLEACVNCIKQETRRYAKRQLTWFRRDSRVQWIYPDQCADFDEVIKKSQKYIESFIKL